MEPPSSESSLAPSVGPPGAISVHGAESGAMGETASDASCVPSRIKTEPPVPASSSASTLVSGPSLSQQDCYSSCSSGSEPVVGEGPCPSVTSRPPRTDTPASEAAAAANTLNIARSTCLSVLNALSLCCPEWKKKDNFRSFYFHFAQISQATDRPFLDVYLTVVFDKIIRNLPPQPCPPPIPLVVRAIQQLPSADVEDITQELDALRFSSSVAQAAVLSGPGGGERSGGGSGQPSPADSGHSGPFPESTSNPATTPSNIEDDAENCAHPLDDRASKGRTGSNAAARLSSPRGSSVGSGTGTAFGDGGVRSAAGKGKVAAGAKGVCTTGNVVRNDARTQVPSPSLSAASPDAAVAAAGGSTPQALRRLVGGISFNRNGNAWVASWVTRSDFKHRYKYFKTADFGFEQARLLAVRFRQHKLLSGDAVVEASELNQRGHGSGGTCGGQLDHGGTGVGGEGVTCGFDDDVAAGGLLGGEEDCAGLDGAGGDSSSDISLSKGRSAAGGSGGQVGTGQRHMASGGAARGDTSFFRVPDCPVEGVYYREGGGGVTGSGSASWQCRWTVGGKKFSKTFAVNKYGPERARELAIRFRLQQMEAISAEHEQAALRAEEGAGEHPVLSSQGMLAPGEGGGQGGAAHHLVKDEIEMSPNRQLRDLSLSWSDSGGPEDSEGGGLSAISPPVTEGRRDDPVSFSSSGRVYHQEEGAFSGLLVGRSRGGVGTDRSCISGRNFQAGVKFDEASGAWKAWWRIHGGKAVFKAYAVSKYGDAVAREKAETAMRAKALELQVMGVSEEEDSRGISTIESSSPDGASVSSPSLRAHQAARGSPYQHNPGSLLLRRAHGGNVAMSSHRRRGARGGYLLPGSSQGSSGGVNGGPGGWVSEGEDLEEHEMRVIEEWDKQVPGSVFLQQSPYCLSFGGGGKWVASWGVGTGRLLLRSFPVARLGFVRAKAMAENWRRSKLLGLYRAEQKRKELESREALMMVAANAHSKLASSLGGGGAGGSRAGGGSISNVGVAGIDGTPASGLSTVSVTPGLSPGNSTTSGGRNQGGERKAAPSRSRNGGFTTSSALELFLRNAQTTEASLCNLRLKSALSFGADDKEKLGSDAVASSSGHLPSGVTLQNVSDTILPPHRRNLGVPSDVCASLDQSKEFDGLKKEANRQTEDGRVSSLVGSGSWMKKADGEPSSGGEAGVSFDAETQTWKAVLVDLHGNPIVQTFSAAAAGSVELARKQAVASRRAMEVELLREYFDRPTELYQGVSFDRASLSWKVQPSVVIQSLSQRNRVIAGQAGEEDMERVEQTGLPKTLSPEALQAASNRPAQSFSVELLGWERARSAAIRYCRELRIEVIGPEEDEERGLYQQMQRDIETSTHPELPRIIASFLRRTSSSRFPFRSSSEDERQEERHSICGSALGASEATQSSSPPLSLASNKSGSSSVAAPMRPAGVPLDDDQASATMEKTAVAAMAAASSSGIRCLQVSDFLADVEISPLDTQAAANRRAALHASTVAAAEAVAAEVSSSLAEVNMDDPSFQPGDKALLKLMTPVALCPSVKGVHYSRRERAWVCRWTDAVTGKVAVKAFVEKKYGFVEAKRLAESYRRAAEATGKVKVREGPGTSTGLPQVRFVQTRGADAVRGGVWKVEWLICEPTSARGEPDISKERSRSDGEEEGDVLSSKRVILQVTKPFLCHQFGIETGRLLALNLKQKLDAVYLPLADKLKKAQMKDGDKLGGGRGAGVRLRGDGVSGSATTGGGEDGSKDPTTDKGEYGVRESEESRQEVDGAEEYAATERESKAGGEEVEKREGDIEDEISTPFFFNPALLSEADIVVQFAAVQRVLQETAELETRVFHALLTKACLPFIVDPPPSPPTVLAADAGLLNQSGSSGGGDSSLPLLPPAAVGGRGGTGSRSARGGRLSTGSTGSADNKSLSNAPANGYADEKPPKRGRKRDGGEGNDYSAASSASSGQRTRGGEGEGTSKKRRTGSGAGTAGGRQRGGTTRETAVSRLAAVAKDLISNEAVALAASYFGKPGQDSPRDDTSGKQGTPGETEGPGDKRGFLEENQKLTKAGRTESRSSSDDSDSSSDDSSEPSDSSSSSSDSSSSDDESRSRESRDEATRQQVVSSRTAGAAAVPNLPKESLVNATKRHGEQETRRRVPMSRRGAREDEGPSGASASFSSSAKSTGRRRPSAGSHDGGGAESQAFATGTSHQPPSSSGMTSPSSPAVLAHLPSNSAPVSAFSIGTSSLPAAPGTSSPGVPPHSPAQGVAAPGGVAEGSVSPSPSSCSPSLTPATSSSKLLLGAAAEAAATAVNGRRIPSPSQQQQSSVPSSFRAGAHQTQPRPSFPASLSQQAVSALMANAYAAAAVAAAAGRGPRSGAPPQQSPQGVTPAGVLCFGQGGGSGGTSGPRAAAAGPLLADTASRLAHSQACIAAAAAALQQQKQLHAQQQLQQHLQQQLQHRGLLPHIGAGSNQAQLQAVTGGGVAESARVGTGPEGGRVSQLLQSSPGAASLSSGGGAQASQAADVVSLRAKQALVQLHHQFQLQKQQLEAAEKRAKTAGGSIGNQVSAAVGRAGDGFGQQQTTEGAAQQGTRSGATAGGAGSVRGGGGMLLAPGAELDLQQRQQLQQQLLAAVAAGRGGEFLAAHRQQQQLASVAAQQQLQQRLRLQQHVTAAAAQQQQRLQQQPQPR